MKDTFINYSNPPVFKVVIDAVVSDLNFDDGTVLIDNKTTLSLANNYEDGEWRYMKLHDFLWDNVNETALPLNPNEISATSKPMSDLRKAAKNLRLDEKGGEIGEILLYAVLRHYYGALPIVPKVFYKQNANDYAKGADSVHIVKTDNCLTYWLGEAKFYNSADDNRLKPVIESIKSTLDKDKLKKEFNIVTSFSGLSEILDASDYEELMNGLGDGISIDDIKKQLHVPIMYLYECKETPETLSSGFDEYTQLIESFHTDLTKAFFEIQDSELNSIYGYEDITFHLILFPTPSKQRVMDDFNETANFHRR